MLSLIFSLLLSASLKTQAAAHMTEARFRELTQEVWTANGEALNHASPNGYSFKLDWQTTKMNGFASNIDGKGEVSLKGGVARHPLITEDGFRAYACHEVAHITGGEPRRRTGLAIYHNLSVECQADYGAAACLRRVFSNQDNVAAVAAMKKVPEVVLRKCREEFSTVNEVAICVRTAMAGYSFVNAFSTDRATEDRKRSPSAALDFAKPDKSKVASTLESYGSPQCRLDSIFQGALGGDRPACWYHTPRAQDKPKPLENHEEPADAAT